MVFTIICCDVQEIWARAVKYLMPGKNAEQLWGGFWRTKHPKINLEDIWRIEK